MLSNQPTGILASMAYTLVLPSHGQSPTDVQRLKRNGLYTSHRIAWGSGGKFYKAAVTSLCHSLVCRSTGLDSSLCKGSSLSAS